MFFLTKTVGEVPTTSISNSYAEGSFGDSYIKRKENPHDQIWPWQDREQTEKTQTILEMKGTRISTNVSFL